MSIREGAEGAELGRNPQEQQSYGAAWWEQARRKHTRYFAAFSHVVVGHSFRKAVSEPAPPPQTREQLFWGGVVEGTGTHCGSHLGSISTQKHMVWTRLLKPLLGILV